MAETTEAASCISDVVRSMTEAGALEVKPCTLDFSDSSRFTKLEPSQGQTIQLCGLLQHLPAAVGAKKMSQAYTVSFPEGLPHILTTLKQGGYSTTLRGEDGKIAGTASLYSMGDQAAVLGAFTAMSVVSGQYFLAQINKRLDAINQTVNSILGFLYGDKRAELLSELRFIQYAYQNYSSIMEHDHQRTATIASIQDAKKVAMKDMEFYLQDLRSFVDEKGKTEEITARVVNLNKSLELTMQLYVMSSLLELYYAQNFDSGYVQRTEGDISEFMETCYERMNVDFSQLKGQLYTEKKNFLAAMISEKTYTAAINTVDSILSSLKTDRESKTRLVHESLYQPRKKMTCYLNRNGEVYTAIQ